jgi:hypothetical protein
MKAERRANPRVRPLQTGHYVYDCTTSVAGWISDISLSGVAFDYLSTNRHVSERPLIDIAEMEAGRRLIQGVACRTVYDVPVLSENLAFKRGVEVRRCGLAFVRPGEEVLAGVADILKRYRIAG